MDIAVTEIESNKHEGDLAENRIVTELAELQLALVGGGIGDTVR